MDERFLIERIHGGQQTPGLGGSKPLGQTDPAAPSDFQKLLDDIRSVGARAEDLSGVDGPAGSLDDLQKAIRRADDDFVTAMDLRRQLEDAYRRLQGDG